MPGRAAQGRTSAIWLALLAALIMEWSLGYALEIAGANLATKLFFGKAQYLGIALAPLLWMIFAINHSNRDKNLDGASHCSPGDNSLLPLFY